MHIHPSSPNSINSLQSEESAAIKIQAGFRGYRVRKQLHHQIRGTTNGYHLKRSCSYRCHQRHQRVMDHQRGTALASVSSVNGRSDQHANSAEGNTVEDRCATKIQAGVRGFLVRKKQKIAADAATKIQASFRGFKARKEAEKLKQK